jgi:hypothetical protein
MHWTLASPRFSSEPPTRDFRRSQLVKSDRKSDSVCSGQSEHQIFRKEAGIPDVPGG